MRSAAEVPLIVSERLVPTMLAARAEGTEISEIATIAKSSRRFDVRDTWRSVRVPKRSLMTRSPRHRDRHRIREGLTRRR
jgi:hypothetical protein